MKVEVTIPNVGESIQEALLAQWFKQDGDMVQKDEPLFVIETDKVTLEVATEESGKLQILIAEGTTVKVGAVIGTILVDAKVKDKASDKPDQKPTKADEPQPSEIKIIPETVQEKKHPPEYTPKIRSDMAPVSAGPGVRRLAAEKGIDLGQIQGSGPDGRITKGDVWLAIESRPLDQAKDKKTPVSPAPVTEDSIRPSLENQGVHRKPMTPIRRRIAQRLLEAKQNTAMLTTFNEIDMSRVFDIRNRYKTDFEKKYGIRLGFMSFFIKASIEALKEIPEINAYVEKDDILFHDYYDVGVAIGSERGLVVPVIRDADQLSFYELEKSISDFVAKIKLNKLEITDLEGGTFTISNGGVYGSLLSTPILNTPQSGILGMHKVEDRPVVVDGQIVIRPMMYVALSYDHRIVDGKGAVTFLKRIKECVENPERIMMEI